MSDLFMDMHHGHRSGPAAKQLSTASVNSGSTTASATTKHASEDGELGEDADAFANILSLKLKKPKHWKWELTTSRSCSNIAIPRILLYDHTGELLVDASSQTEQTYKPEEDHPTKSTATRRKRLSSKAATSNLAHSIRKALDAEFNGLQIQEATPTPERSVLSTQTSLASGNSVDFYTNELSDYVSARRSNSLKSVRFLVDDSKDGANNSFHIVDLPTPPSTTTTATTTASSGSGPREKRRYRRSRSSGRSSESILERFSFNRGRFSSPEYAEEHEVYHPPRYFLRTSKAGTLVVQEESFSRYRRRRKPKESSSENIQHDSAAKNRSMSSLKVSDASLQQGSLQNGTELRKRLKKKVLPMRRYRSDANVVLQKQLSTSDEEPQQQQRSAKEFIARANAKHNSQYAHFRSQSKRDLITIDPDPHALGSATAR